MKLSTALSQNATKLKNAQGAYQQAVYDVSNGMSSVFASTLTAVNHVPANWNEIVAAYQAARVDALKWTNQVYASLQETPDDVMNYNDIITSALNDAIEQAQALVADPNDKTAKKVLDADLKTISSKINLVNVFVSGCLDSVNEFGITTLPDAAKNLATVANDAYEDYQIDQGKIDDLKKQIKETQDEITRLAVEIGITSAAIAATLVVGVCFMAMGPAEWVMVGIGVAAEASVIALDALQLEADQNKLKTLNSELDSYSKDASSLQITSDTYSEMSAQTVALGTSVDSISTAWTSVENDVNEAINDISNAKYDESTGNYNALYDDLVAALDVWNETYALCGSLEINIEGNPAQLTIGMSSEQVTEATAADPTVDYVTYINNYQTLYAKKSA